MFGVIIGTGVGGGIVIDGAVWSGPQNIAGEWGHHRVDPDGPLSYCGRRGCVETLLCGPALARAYAAAGGGTADAEVVAGVALGVAPWSGRVYVGGEKVADHTLGPGAVLPQLVHGGPGRAGGGEELGGLRGLSLYLQRTAVQGYKPLLEKLAAGGARRG